MDTQVKICTLSLSLNIKHMQIQYYHVIIIESKRKKNITKTNEIYNLW